jgi:FkbM family methyltransferase
MHTPSILQQAQTAFNKLRFCYRVAATPVSFIRLLLNTKKFRWANTRAIRDNQPPVAYYLQLNNHQRIFYLRTNLGDIQIFYDIFWRTIYQLPAPLLAKATTVIDMGAHIGMVAAYFSSQCPQATIYCIEADDSNYALLTKNLQSEITNGTVIAEHAAISNRNEVVYLQKSARSYNSQLADTDTVTNYPVKGIRMEQFLQEHGITHIDIIKIDIEGAEAFLFDNDLNWLSITNTIIIEIHSENNLQQFTTAVTKFGFHIEKRSLENEDLFMASKQ